MEQERCRTGGIGKVGQRTAGMQDWRDARLEGCKSGGMQERRVRNDAIQEGCSTGGIRDRYSTSVMQENRDLDGWNSGRGMQDR